MKKIISLNFIGIYFLFDSKKNANDSFSKGLVICRNNVKKDTIQCIYDCAKNNVPIENILKTMKIV